MDTPRASTMLFSIRGPRCVVLKTLIFLRNIKVLRGVGVSGDAADFIYVFVRAWFSLCRSQNVDFPKEYEGFWAVGICRHAADFNNVVLHPWSSLCRSQNVDFPKEYQGFVEHRR